MKSPSSLILLLALSSAFAGELNQVRSVKLDDRVVVTVPVATNRVTTISFPGPIAGVDAAGVTTDPKVPGQFQLAHTRDSAFLSVRALARKAATNLNVRWNKKTYVFELVESDNPVLSLNMEANVPSAPESAPDLSPTRLLALLDKAKAFPLLKQQHPEAVAHVEFKTFAAKPSDFGEYEVQIEEVFRFNPEDTLVFHIVLRNKTGREFRYKPNSFSVRAGDRLYNQSISDATGLLAPEGVATIYFAITGTPDGGRNELSLKNDFTVLLTRITPPIPAVPTNSPSSTVPTAP